MGLGAAGVAVAADAPLGGDAGTAAGAGAAGAATAAFACSAANAAIAGCVAACACSVAAFACPAAAATSVGCTVLFVLVLSICGASLREAGGGALLFEVP